ncbi:MAG: hypothetical protein KDD47_07600 [Acidobacteria bacterium]|nr:hypothetical protein [Acidobacteriota bacterium]
MVTIGSLWLAILVSAVLVWLASAVVWMVLPHHKKEFRGLPDEEAARQVLGKQGLTPGIYNIPHCDSQAQMKDPAMLQKWKDGPVAFLTVMPGGVPSMGKNLVQTFVVYLLVGVMVAYVTGRTLAPGTDYLQVFRIAGTTAWLAYGFAYLQDAVWFGKPWASTIKALFDALIYALLTAGVFGWLWP